MGHLPKPLGKEIKPLLSIMTEGEWFADDATIRAGAIYLIKVSENNYKIIKPLLSEGKIHSKDGKAIIDIIIAGYKIRFQSSGKTKKTADAKTTRMQELASMWIIRRAIQDNKRYKTWRDISKDPKWSELEKIYPDIDDIWLKALHASHITMLREFADVRFSEYSRDGGFMQFISDLVKDEYGISRKDTWNPADIWLVKDETSREDELKKVAKGVAPKIEQLNEVMKKQFNKRQIIGVSLKKISGKDAIWEEVNVGDVVFKSDNYKFQVNFIRCKLSSKDDGSFASSDSIISIKDKATIYKFQMRPNSPGLSNQKLEPSQVGAGAARLGKVPQDMFRPMIKEDYGMSYTNKWREYPQDAKTFSKNFATWYSKFTTIFDNGVETEIRRTKSAFKESILNSFKTDNDGVTTGKLMQLDFISQLFDLKKKKREELLTNMLFLAMKKGEKFGPFGKLY
mgnify:FL=1